MRLTPQYDLVASAYYKQFQTVALAVGRARDIRIGDLGAKHIIALAEDFSVSQATLELALKDLGGRLEAAQAMVEKSETGPKGMRDHIVSLMEKRWNGTFASLGRLLSKKRAGGAKK